MPNNQAASWADESSFQPISTPQPTATPTPPATAPGAPGAPTAGADWADPGSFQPVAGPDQAPPPDKFQQGEDFKSKTWQDIGDKLLKQNDYLGAIHSFASLFSSQNPAAQESYRQLQQGGIGAAKAVGRGAGVLGDLATLGLTHLLPQEWRPPGTGLGYTNVPQLQPSNEDQRAGGYLGELGMFATGEGIFDALADLPLVERITQAGKLLDIVKAHPELAASVGRVVKGAGAAATGGLVATGSPKQAAIAGTVGAAAGAVGEAAGPIIQAVRRPVGKALQAIEQAVPPDVTGMAVPQLAHAQRVAGRVGRAMAAGEEAAAEAPTAIGPEESPLIHQPFIQQGIQDRLSDLAVDTASRATQAEQKLLGITRTTPIDLMPSPNTPLRDMAEELSDKIENMAQQNFFKPIDDATDVGEGGQFTKLDKALKKNADDLRHAVDPDVQARLEEQRTGLRGQMDDVIDMAKKAGVDPKVADFASDLWKQKSALDDLDAQIKAAMPHHLQVNGPQIDVKSLVNRVGKLREAGRSSVTGPGRLADAFGGSQARADAFKALTDEAYRRASAPIFPPEVSGQPGAAATRPARPSLAPVGGAAATVGRQPAAPAATTPRAAPAATPAAPAPSPTKSPAETTNVWQAFPDQSQFADLLNQMEGGKTNPTAVRNNNPGNLKDTSGKFMKFDSWEEGQQALQNKMARWQRLYPDMTIAQFNRKYAPDKRHGGDNPDGTEDGRNRRMMSAMAGG